MLITQCSNSMLLLSVNSWYWDINMVQYFWYICYCIMIIYFCQLDWLVTQCTLFSLFVHYEKKMKDLRLWHTNNTKQLPNNCHRNMLTWTFLVCCIVLLCIVLHCIVRCFIVLCGRAMWRRWRAPDQWTTLSTARTFVCKLLWSLQRG